MALSLVAPAPTCRLDSIPQRKYTEHQKSVVKGWDYFCKGGGLGGLQPREGNEPSQMTPRPPLLLPQKLLTHVSLCSAPQTLL